jgi:hypothetical protein
MRATLSLVGRKLFGHCRSTAVARSTRAHSSVRCQPASTGAVSRNPPTCPRSLSGSGRFSRRYVGLPDSWVTSCQAFIVNSKPGGTAARQRASTASGGGS